MKLNSDSITTPYYFIGITTPFTLCSNSKVETIANESDIDDVFEQIYTRIISVLQKKRRKV